MFVVEAGTVSKLTRDAGCYFCAVKRYLCLAGKERKAALSRLKDRLIGCRCEYDLLVRELGTPKAYANSLNNSIPGVHYHKSFWRYPFLLLGIISLLAGAFQAAVLGLYHISLHHPGMFLGIQPPASAVGIIGGADGPTALYISAVPAGNTALTMLVSIALAAVGFLGYYRLRHIRSTLKSF